MSYVKHTLIVLIGALLTAGVALAQVNRGTVTGIVTDPSGAVIPGVAVSVTNEATGVATNSTTTSAGVYTAPLLIPGTYTVTAVRHGFKKYVQTGIVVNVGTTVRADVSMSLGATTKTVQVTGRAPLLQRESSEMGTTIGSTEVEDLPLTGTGDAQRTPATFMQLAPGVTGRGSATGNPSQSRAMTTAVSGSIVSSTTLKLDGGDLPTASGFEGDLRTLQVPPDAVQEFKLVAVNAPAEYGRSAGGTASFEVKSGTNQIHGTAYEYLRNTALNANPWFINAAAPGCDSTGRQSGNPTQACRAPYKQNEFGVTAGGPIKKDKAFLFGWYDGFRLIKSASTGTFTVPTAQMLNGNFQQAGVPTLYDPLNQTTCGTLICDNIIMPGATDPVSAKIVPLMQRIAPTGANAPIVNNFTSTVANPVHINMYGFKGDYVINQNNRLSILYDYGTNTSPNIPQIPAPLEGGDQPSVNNTRNVRVNYSLVLRPNLINQTTLSFNQWNTGTQPVALYGGRNDWVSYLGLKGFSPIYGTQFPQIVLDGYSFNGGGGASFQNNHSEGIDDSVTWVKGKHTLKFGFQWLKEQMNALGSGRTAGYFNYRTSETGLLGNPNTGYGTASFMLGRADEMQAQYINAPSYDQVGYYAGYAQDDFKVTKKLTLNLGVRWDLFTPDVQKYNTKGWINPTLPNPDLTPNIQGMFVLASPSNRSGVQTYSHLFSPRVGLAYALNDKTVVRLGYGIYYGQGNATQLAGSALVQGFNGNTGTSSSNGLTPGFIWSTDSAVPFVPSFSPNTLLGQGTPFHSAGSLIELAPGDGKPPYAQNWNVTVQRELPGQMTLTVAYVGNTGIHLPSRGLAPMDKMPPQYLTLGSTLGLPITDSSVQALPVVQNMPVDPATGNHSPFNGFEALYSCPSGGACTLGQSLRMNPQYQGLHRYYEALGVSNYNALQVKLDKRFRNGLSLLVSYAWSKTLTDGGSMFSTFSTNFGSTNQFYRNTQKGPSFEDTPNNLSIAYVYELPLGKGKQFLNQGGVVNQIVGGWKWSGVLTYLGGLPQNIQTGPSSIPGGLEDQGWGNANAYPGVPQRCASASGHFDPHKDCLINEAAFFVPAPYTFGSYGSMSAAVRQFGYDNENMSLMKDWNIDVHDRQFTLRFNADFFNIFNRTIFNQDGSMGSYAAEPVINQPGFGLLGGQTNEPRYIQFGLKLRW